MIPPTHLTPEAMAEAIRQAEELFRVGFPIEHPWMTSNNSEPCLPDSLRQIETSSTE